MCSFNNLQASQAEENELCKYDGNVLNATQSELLQAETIQLSQEDEQAQILKNQMQILDRKSPNNDKMNDQNQNDIQLALVPVKKVKKSKIKKEKLTKKLFRTHVLLNNSQQSKQEQIYSDKPEYIFRLVPSRKIFFLPGDIFVEVEDKTKPDLLNGTIFNEFRNICQVEKNELSVSFKIESMKPMKVLNEAIYELENSQNQENYDEAQVLKQYQETIVIIQEDIQSVIDFYSACPDDLLRLIAEREVFMLQEKKKILKQISQNDEFASIGSLMLSFANKTTTISHISIARPSVALIGGEDEELLEHFLRNGFLNLFNYASRKNMFNVFIQIQQRDLINKQSTGADKNLVFWFPQFEIYSLDQIKIVCNCEITQVQIQYPPQLHFQGSNCQLLNQLESFFVVHFDITQRHIEMLMQLRQGQFSSQLVNMRDTYEVSNMEYDIKSQLFLEKYYKEHYEQIKTEEEEQKIKEKNQIIEANRISCKYRLL